MKKALFIFSLLVFLPQLLLADEKMQKAEEAVAYELSDELNSFIDEVDPPDDGGVSSLPELPDQITTMEDLVNQPDETTLSEVENGELETNQEEVVTEVTSEPKKPASVVSAPKVLLKSGFHKTARVCPVKLGPKSVSKTDGNVSKGRKIWVDVVDSNWVKIYRKKGEAFISADCLKRKAGSAVTSL